MSYDLYLYVVPPGEDALSYSLRRQAAEAEEINPGPLDAPAEARKKALADALRQHDSALEPFSFGFGEIAASQGISEAEARLRYRHIELNGPDDGPGIQITLFDHEATVTLPYWHPGARASEVWRQTWAYLGVLCSTSGYTVFDPQLEKVLDLASDQEDVVQIYRKVVAQTASLANRPRESKSRPWWKLW